MLNRLGGHVAQIATAHQPAYAKHLVEEAFAASYITTQTEIAEPQAKRSKKQTETEK